MSVCIILCLADVTVEIVAVFQVSCSSYAILHSSSHYH